jgi:flagellar hook-associated protein 2
MEVAMGIVGLSFGSPTSGDGFNVSSTVATIVSNLQNVETPWKTQLKSLQSQDTVISSLGTLFSTFSNDMSTLTELNGIMAQKDGSSSDTGVLSLTAADSTAVAGTHTISVTSLAQTSSGYLAPVTSATTPLTGAITLQVGSGTAQTITLTSSDNTLTGLASAINSSGVGITASVMTDSSGARLSLVSGTSGADGDITVSANSISTVLGYTASTSTGNSTGTLKSITNASDTLSGSMTIQVGSGTTETVVLGAAPSSGAAANTIYTGSGVNTLAGIVTAITNANIGVSASVVTNTDGSSSLQLVSGTATTTGTLTVVSSIADTSTSTLAYTSPVAGKDAVLTIDGINTTSSSNTVTNLINGVTFQLLAPSAKESDGSLEQVQVVIANDNSAVESTFAAVVSDYNALLSAINAQEGLDSSNNAEPLFGSPTLSMLQQQLLNGLNLQNPNGYMDSVSTATNTTLTGSLNVTVGSGTTQKIVIGAAPTPPLADTFYTGSTGSTLQELADTINAAAAGTNLSYTGTAGTDATADTAATASTGTLTSITDASLALSGAISITVGSGTKNNFVIGATPTTGAAANTTYTGDGVDTLSALADAINSASMGVTATVTTPSGGVSTLSLTSTTTGTAGTLSVTSSLVAAGIGVTAKVVTTNGESSLALLSQTSGSSGALTVKSSVSATSDMALSFTSTAGTSTKTATAGLTALTNASDNLTGSVTIQVGSGTAQTISLPSGGGTLSDLMTAINDAKAGLTAAIGTNSSGQSVLSLTSGTAGSAGTLTITSSILDTTNTSTASLNYTNSSDVGSIGSLGISINNDGTISLDVASLDSLLNSDFSGVTGFFQNSDSWGQAFSTMLTDAGTSSTTGILALASTSNSNIESTLNAEISREETMISAQQVSLTAELNSANEIMQELPTQLTGVNELYSAITGYNQSSNG